MYKIMRWAPHDRSGKVTWLLNEIGAPYEIQELDHKEVHNSPEYRKLHPLGYVPVLQDLRNGISMFESGAIALYLSEAHPESLMNGAPESVERAKCYQWLMYNFATLEPAIEAYWLIDENDPQSVEKKIEIDAKVALLVKPIEEALDSDGFIAGAHLTAADICLGQSIFWLRRRPLLALFPRTQMWLERLKKRPAAIKSEIFNLPS